MASQFQSDRDSFRSSLLFSMFTSALLLAATSAGAVARALPPQIRRPAGPPADTSYLAGMPSVDKVKQVIQGSNPTDTLARQVAVFNLMPTFIQRMGLAPGRRFGDTTPEERGYLNQYAAAAYQISQDYGKSHTPAEAQAFLGLHNHYESDEAFYKELFDKLFTTKFLEPYAKVNRDAAAAYQAQLERERAQNTSSQNPLVLPGKPDASASPSGLGKDETRCLELGGSKGHCVKNSLMKFGDAVGKIFGGPEGGKPPPAPHGLQMNGEYAIGTGMVLDFTAGRMIDGIRNYGGVSLSGCSKLVMQTVGYSITPRANQYVVQIGTHPQPVAMALNPNGQMIGPGAVSIAGQIITGYNLIAHSKRYSDGTMVPGSAYTEKVPVYAPATATCSFGAFQPVPQTYAKQDQMAISMVGVNDNAGKPIPTGPIMSGVYSAAGGLRVDFQVDDAVIDCGAAHVMAQYSVRNTGGQVSIAVANGKSLFTLALKPDGSLAGSGTVEVDSRLLTGQDASGEYTFKPVSASCNVSALAVN
ncbi:MAG TPA: hypothetical protein VKV95_08875 [Terriglobia bacterium]|nr:hypothetical protein [Terriglobia bacterium]